MINLNLEDVSKELERLNNELEYYENRLEEIKSLIYPRSFDYTQIKVDSSNKFTDSMLKYVEIENREQLEVTILYIKSKIRDLEKWKDKELERLSKYGEYVKAVVFLREKEFKFDGRKKRHLTWQEIANKCHCGESTARLWYKLGTEERKNTPS